MSTQQFSLFDNECMTLAIQQAWLGIYTTKPNPNVGCVIAKENQVLATGYHSCAGLGHAEVNALAKLSKGQVEGSTVYVTLEPCSHIGRTGACAQALIDAKVAKVICAMQDPNPVVAGKGFALLRAAGIEVQISLQEIAAKALNKGFIKRMSQQLPWIAIKLAMSLDGRTAMDSGESQWITGSPARSDVQKLRASSCAIITGIGSIEQDDSSLTVRKSELGLCEANYDVDLIVQKQPLRVVLDSQNRISANAKVLQQAGRTLRVIAQPLRAEDGENVISLPNKHGQVDLKALLQYLAEHEQCNSVLVEAGATLAGRFVEQELFDQLIVFMAPTILGASAKPLLAIAKDKMAQQQRLKMVDQRFVGEDLRLTYEQIQ